MKKSGADFSMNALATSAANDENSNLDAPSNSKSSPLPPQPASLPDENPGVKKRGNFTPELKCKVCADTSSGKHYGVLACNGCSGFFKRSVRRKLIYRCQTATGTCIVDKTHRNQCQACRLKKCLEVGMNKHAVQNERQPRNLATVRPKNVFSRSSPSMTEKIADTENCSDYTTSPRSTRPKRQEETLYNDITCGVNRSQGRNHNMINAENENYQWGESFKGPPFIISPTSFCCTADDTSLHAYTTWQEPVYESSARILFLAVRWARNLPAYANLAFRDQVILLEETWPKLFIMSAIQWSMPLDSSPLFVMDNSVLIEATDSKSVSLAQKTLHSLQKTLARFKHFGVDLAEFACLKAILLFQANIRGLKDATKIEALQDHAQFMLSEHVHSKPDERLRFGRLLLLLQNVYEVRSETLEYLFFHKINGNVPIEKMLCDMFKY